LLLNEVKTQLTERITTITPFQYNTTNTYEHVAL
jgi:hypothetical protein